MSIKYNPTLYSKPPKTPIPGARFDYQRMNLTTADTTNTTQILGIAILPAGCRAHALRIEIDGMESSPGSAFRFIVGLLNKRLNDPDPSSLAPSPLDGASIANVMNSLCASIMSITFGSTNTRVIAANATAGSTVGGYVSPDAGVQLGQMWGVDPANDRIIAIQVSTAAGSAIAAGVAISLGFDIGIPGYPASD